MRAVIPQVAADQGIDLAQAAVQFLIGLCRAERTGRGLEDLHDDRHHEQQHRPE